MKLPAITIIYVPEYWDAPFPTLWTFPLISFRSGLVRMDEKRFVFRFKPAQIDHILQKLMSRRTEPGIPRATEMVFSNLDVVLHHLDLPEMANYARMAGKDDGENPVALFTA